MDPWRRFETKISTKEREGEKTLSTRPSPPPDDSFSNGFLTHRIPSRDNVHDSSRASCVHKGKVAGIDRLFPRFSLSLLRVNIILISAEIWNGVERVRAWMHRSGAGIEIPIFNARFSNAVSPRNSRHSFKGFQGLKTQYLNYSPSFEMDARSCLSRWKSRGKWDSPRVCSGSTQFPDLEFRTNI